MGDTAGGSDMGKRKARLRAAAIGFQVAAVAGCAAIGWHLTHSAASAAIRLQPSSQAPVVGFADKLAQPALAPAPQSAGGAARPSLSDLVRRVNRDDANLYRGQWHAIQGVASASRAYIERHILPLLLAAARGGNR
jgi:hypothetical protein